MQDLSEFRPSRLWKKLSSERRLAAAELFWSDEQSTEQQIEAVGALASHMKFRPKSVIGLPLEKKAKYLATLPAVSDTVAARALVNWLISEENVTKPDEAKLKAAAADLSSKFPKEDVLLYFSTLVSQDPETWGPLAEMTSPASAAKAP